MQLDLIYRTIMNKQPLILLLVILALATTAPFSNAQSRQLSETQLSRLLKRFPQADANGDGKLTQEEFDAARKKFQQTTRGKGSRPQPRNGCRYLTPDGRRKTFRRTLSV